MEKACNPLQRLDDQGPCRIDWPHLDQNNLKSRASQAKQGTWNPGLCTCNGMGTPSCQGIPVPQASGNGPADLLVFTLPLSLLTRSLNYLFILSLAYHS